MPTRVPFTVYFKVAPNRANGKRFEYVRALQKMGADLYAALDTNDARSDGLYVSIPGGGQFNNIGRFSTLSNGSMVKPQFGESPAQLVITGFFEQDIKNTDVYEEKSVFNCNEQKIGANSGTPWSSNPKSDVSDEVVNLRSVIDTAVAAYVLGFDITYFRIDYKGVRFGDRGFHFPRP